MKLHPADVMIVLGRVDSRGILTKDAHERIRYGASLFRQGLASIVVAPSKGSYKLGKFPEISEAATIKAHLEQYGVPADAILTEEQSCDTLGGAYFLKVDYALKHGWKSILVITSDDHLERTKYVFHKVFGEQFTIQYACGNRVLSDREYRMSIAREARSLQLMETTWIGPIKPGDHRHVRSIFRLHPGYNPNAKLSSADIERLVQNQKIEQFSFA